MVGGQVAVFESLPGVPLAPARPHGCRRAEGMARGGCKLIQLQLTRGPVQSSQLRAHSLLPTAGGGVLTAPLSTPSCAGLSPPHACMPAHPR